MNKDDETLKRSAGSCLHFGINQGEARQAIVCSEPFSGARADRSQDAFPLRNLLTPILESDMAIPSLYSTEWREGRKLNQRQLRPEGWGSDVARTL